LGLPVDVNADHYAGQIRMFFLCVVQCNSLFPWLPLRGGQSTAGEIGRFDGGKCCKVLNWHKRVLGGQQLLLQVHVDNEKSVRFIPYPIPSRKNSGKPV